MGMLPQKEAKAYIAYPRSYAQKVLRMAAKLEAYDFEFDLDEDGVITAAEARKFLRGEVPFLEFDTCITRQQSYAAEVPSYAVENGFVINDTITIQPLRLDVSAIMTDIPIEETHRAKRGGLRSRLDDLVKVFRSRDTIDFYTEPKAYTNMAIVSLSITEAQNMAGAVQINMSMQQIETVNLDAVGVDAYYGRSETSGASNGNGEGENKNDTDADSDISTDESASWLSEISGYYSEIKDSEGYNKGYNAVQKQKEEEKEKETPNEILPRTGWDIE